MSNDAKEATAAEAIKYLTGLAMQFNNSATNPESATKLRQALASFIERHDGKKQPLQDDLESVKFWAESAQLLLKRAVDLAASKKSGSGPAYAARGNIDMALGILNRLRDPAFAASRVKKDKIQPTMAVAPSVMGGGNRFVILGKSQVTTVPGGLRKPS
jgi:hypothetical protein